MSDSLRHSFSINGCPKIYAEYNGKKLIVSQEDKSFSVKVKNWSDPIQQLFLKFMGIDHTYLENFEWELQTFRDNMKRVYVHI